MDNLTYINGATVSATDIRKSWAKIVKSVKESRKPAFVLTNNTPEAVVLSFEEYQQIEQRLVSAERFELQQRLSEVSLQFMKDQEIKPPMMKADENGVFHEVKDAD